jgi:hypothetical protein
MAAGRTPGRHLGKPGHVKMRILLISGNRGKGLISSDSDLLRPRFYLNRSLEEWLYEKAKKQISLHPSWTF